MLLEDIMRENVSWYLLNIERLTDSTNQRWWADITWSCKWSRSIAMKKIFMHLLLLSCTVNTYKYHPANATELSVIWITIDARTYINLTHITRNRLLLLIMLLRLVCSDMGDNGCRSLMVDSVVDLRIFYVFVLGAEKRRDVPKMKKSPAPFEARGKWKFLIGVYMILTWLLPYCVLTLSYMQPPKFFWRIHQNFASTTPPTPSTRSATIPTRRHPQQYNSASSSIDTQQRPPRRGRVLWLACRSTK